MEEFCLKRLKELAWRHRNMDQYSAISLSGESEQIRLQEQLFELQAKIAGYDLHITWDVDVKAYRIVGTVG